MNNINLGNIGNAYIPEPASLDIGGSAGGSSFTDVLKSAVDSVNASNDSAAAQVKNVLQGGGGSDLNSVMIAVEKADVSFQLMMQVRNKIVSAYQDIEKMQF
ncbi:MAG TPA: flagellar hook-basal body complex protein FliE [Acidobacteriaceae bacterium]|nr:flagellar hook-basal body complex protein FliE [Acidobacteriaceae bacterium]